MKQYDVIIIGGGHNGLLAGAYLAKAGAKVLILERRSETGGAIMTDEQSGCRLNTHACYMMMMDKAPAYNDLQLQEYGCTYITPQPAVSFLTKDGKALCLYNDPEKSARSIARFSSKDADKFKKIYAEFTELFDECIGPQTYRPTLPPLEMLDLVGNKPIGKRLFELSEKTPWEIINECGFESETLKAALLYLTTMWGINPEVSGVGFLVPLYIVRMLNAALVRGGSHRLSSAIYKVFIANGGTVEDTLEVGQILMDGSRAVGVKTTNGLEFKAKCVISTVDPPQTFLRFLGEERINRAAPGLAETIKGWVWEEVSHYVLHLIVDRPPEFAAATFDPDADNAFIQIMGVDTMAEVLANFKAAAKGEPSLWGHVTTFTKFDPSQKPSVLARFLPESEAPTRSLQVLRFENIAPFSHKGGDWEDLKDKYAAQLEKLLCNYAPNLTGAKFIRRYAYPPTYIEQKFLNMQKGSIKHGEYISTQMGYLRPNDLCSRYRTPVQGLYVAGASVYPGGMVLLANGYNAAQVVAEDLGITPWWSIPANIKAAIDKGLAI
ncbi:NAD(P)/FAD-dependent oxidoreductase [Desulfallas sp. Bu1-1]|uniref:phytoene desaturase family protein n=1 Tax=Desulfallas sp. Bu1-1 TaxID=2787620 RepID=UPI0018A0CABE|nr:NAD(P)/FAD-dependent oxidoreductase [Desulfallas sp. Bu1-1]MBF7083012.1 NAD(P)/FAD-dependent oxidoreductase [Desulfallas sp. Bu1-1]